MSESSNIKKVVPLHQIKKIVIIIVVILALGYIGGYFILPVLVESSYQDGACESVLSRNDIYSSAYPFAITNESNAEYVKECAIYILAVTNEEAGLWRDSYNAFSVYEERYPKGVFMMEVHEHSAVVLMGLVNEDVEQNNYSKADNGLDLILEYYEDTATALEAKELKSDLRMALGKDLRDAGDFEGAEKIFKEFNAQAQENNQEDDVKSSQMELAQTYLDWGLELQSQENFAEAKAKFDIAITTDPDPSSGSGPAAQANASLADLYVQWGDYLITQKDFANAMQLYKTAAMFSEAENPSVSNQIIANGYVQWAAELINEDDFRGALVLLDFAQQTSDTDTTKALVDDTRSDLILAFSQSDGEQAHKAIENAIRIVCVHHIRPSLPIFGLDQENIKAGVHGIDERFPESIVAATPASLHFVACVEEENKVVGTLTLPVSTTVFGGGPGTVQITYTNFQFIWNVVLRKAETGEEVDTTTIEGGKPADLSLANISFTTFNYIGAKPAIADLVDWIEEIIK